MKVALIGATGQLGSDLAVAFRQEDLVLLTHADVEVRDHVSVRAVLSEMRPDVVINTSAFHNVDLCEERIDDSFAVNAFAVKNLAEVCRDLDCTLVHFSSDYVFSGDKGSPYTEDDLPRPINVYGVSKLAGEHFIQSLWPKHMIVRTSGLFGTKGARAKGGNFVETMMRLGREREVVKVVTDQVLSPTFTPDLAAKVYELAHCGRYGLYHLTGSGYCSWYEFASRIFALAKLSARLEKTTTAQFGAKARRPAFSSLENAAISQLGLKPLRHWEEALENYMRLRE